MNIIITESQEEFLMNKILEDTEIQITTDDKSVAEPLVQELCGKRLSVKKYLDKYYKKGTIPSIKDGKPTKIEVAVLSDGNGKLLRTLTDKQLFNQVQADFKNILPELERDQFLKDCIVAWYYDKINDSGTLSN